jgi:hypothetical protein
MASWEEWREELQEGPVKQSEPRSVTGKGSFSGKKRLLQQY